MLENKSYMYLFDRTKESNNRLRTIIIGNEEYRLIICNYSISLMSSLYYTTGKLPWEDTGSIYIERILRRKQ